MIKVGIVGYGNLGKGVEAAVNNSEDMELAGVFTRRSPENVAIKSENVGVYLLDEALKNAEELKKKVDVMIICAGSATDLPKMTPMLAEYFNVIDSFDTHANIPSHFAKVNESAEKGGNVAIISVGWDPGMFSVNRLYSSAILPKGNDYTFWGKGVSQGHSDAIRRIKGVVDARQYTVPVENALERVRKGENPTLTAREKHLRECYVVAEEDADKKAIENEIITMPNYFADYDTTVHFISMEELQANHSGIPHGGFVIRTGTTGWDNNTKHTIEYSLKLESNPEFTGSVLTAYARAAYRLNKKGECGCKTVFDIAPALISPLSSDEIRAKML